MIITCFVSAEEYVDKVELFIPYGDADSLLGYKPPYYEIKENGDTGHIELGRAATAWDIQNDKIYVADGVKSKILVYSLAGKYLRSIGLWKEETDEIKIKTSAGETLTLKARELREWDPNQKKFVVSQGNKYYYEKIGLIAVDGSGNIYAITDVSLKNRGVMKFSPDGKLLGIINKFGQYGPDDIKTLGFQVRSDIYGDIIVGMLLEKGGQVFAKFDRSGNFMWVKERAYPRDKEGYLYNMLPDGKGPSAPDTSVIVSKMNSQEVEIKKIKIYFEPPSSRGVGFSGVDGKGNLFLSLEPMYRKYDQNGNLLAKISCSSIVFEKGLADVESIPLTKFMADGSFYIGYNLRDGFHLIKYYIKPGTEGKILEPAVTPNTKKN